MRPLSLAVALVLCVSLSADDKANDKELKQFQGDWQMIAMTIDGKKLDGDQLKGHVWRFEGTKVTPLDDRDDAATIVIDATKKPPTLDIKDKRGKVVAAIYKFTGNDSLTICGGTEKGRPKEFGAAKGSDAILFELERVKKK